MYFKLNSVNLNVYLYYKLVQLYTLSPTRHNFLHRFCEAMSSFAKLLSPKGKLWIVALLLLALQLKYEMLPTSSNFIRKYI